MYAASVTGRFALDDILDCPFRELGLIEPVWDDKKRFRFVLGAKPTLPAAVVTFACLDYLARVEPGARTSTISRLTHAIGSPGRVFKLTEEAVGAAIAAFAGASQDAELLLTAAAGVSQVAFSAEPRSLAAAALSHYYRQFGKTLGEAVSLDDEPAMGPTPLFDTDRAPAGSAEKWSGRALAGMGRR
jgi:hypothetical protein